jgi:hypothetical protein
MHQMHISNTQVSSVMLRSKKLEIQEKRDNWKSRRMITKQSAMKLSQIRRRIELCLKEIMLHCFEMNLYLIFFFTVQFILVFQSKYWSTEQLGCRDPRGLTVHQQRPRPRS